MWDAGILDLFQKTLNVEKVSIKVCRILFSSHSVQKLFKDAFYEHKKEQVLLLDVHSAQLPSFVCEQIWKLITRNGNGLGLELKQLKHVEAGAVWLVMFPRRLKGDQFDL
ncbi:hypothetical protein CRENBAI_007416 [Crenichthys baileyi]|uniref:Uncharacterized protein n=1 Tax=Crenichthys baileyi TaxID=28760 RepID=A0AAV9R1S0_9TELE